MPITENIFKEELEKRKQQKIEELVLDFLQKRRKGNGAGYTVEEISKEMGLNAHLVGILLKTSLLYKKWVEWVEHKGVDYFRATSAS